MEIIALFKKKHLIKKLKSMNFKLMKFMLWILLLVQVKENQKRFIFFNNLIIIKFKQSEFRTTVYKREFEKTYILKTKSARAFYNEVNLKYPSLCFSMRALEDEIVENFL